MLEGLREQKEEEDKYFDRKDGDDLSPMPLDKQCAAKAFNEVKRILENRRGNRGIPLARVI